MEKAVVTKKGQVTLPKRVRERLGIKAGDKLLFEVEDDGFRVRVLHRRGIDELFAALPGAPIYAGEAAERLEGTIGRILERTGMTREEFEAAWDEAGRD